MVLHWKDTASGLCGAVCCTYAGLPFDVVKVRLQNQPTNPGAGNLRYSGVLDCLAKTLRQDGLTTFFRGALPALGSAGVENAVGITVQHAVHHQLALAYGDKETRFSMRTECLIGAFTGIFTSLAMCPFEVVKVNAQIASGKGVGSLLREVMKAEGVKGLYRGLSGLWARDIPFNALFFGGYETTCTMMMWLGGHKSKEELSSLQIMGAGGFAGAFGWSCVVPFDVVKTRQQTGQVVGSPVHIMRHILQREGMASLFSGWAPAVFRAMPANAGLFLGVELSSRWLQRLMAE